MRKSLFALENADLDTSEVDLETGSEVAEAADVTIETEDDLGEVEQVADAVEEGTDAAGQMEEVEALVEDAVENGEGLDPVAAEAVRISVEAICSRIGADPKAVYSLYATENFQSASSRKANSRIALEGIKEFLKDLWEKIKSAIKKMWDKMKAFWNKHLSNLGRLRKAVESLRTKVKAVDEKKLKKVRLEKIPGSLARAFPGPGDLNFDVVMKILQTESTDAKAVMDGIEAHLKEIQTNPTVNNLKKHTEKMAGGTVTLVTGEGTTKWTVEAEDDDGKFKIVKNFEAGEAGSEDRNMVVPKKTEMENILKVVLESVKNMQSQQAKSTKIADTGRNAVNALDRAVQEAANSAKKDETKEALSKNMRALNNAISMSVRLDVEQTKVNIRTSYSALNFVSVAVKQYTA